MAGDEQETDDSRHSDGGIPLKDIDSTSKDSGVCDDPSVSNHTTYDYNSKGSGDSDNCKNLLPKHVGGKERYIEEQTHIKYSKDSNGSSDNAFWLKVVIIFSILDVLLFATILVVAFGLPCSDSSTPDQSGNCLNCTDVYLTDDDKIDNIYNFTIHGDMCCSENETLLIQKYVIKRYRSDQAKVSAERGFPNRTAIHVDLDRDDLNSIKEGTDQVLKWRAPTLMYGALSLSPDGTRILLGRTGLYYVSARVVFDDKKGDIGKAGLDPMTLQLYRERDPGEKQLLLEAKETHCAHSDTKCSKPSSGQGVFKMEKGDNVLVKVTKPCGLVLQDKLNHFDMYLI